MEKKEMAQHWAEKMNAEPDAKKRNGIVAEMCREHGLKTGDAWKMLKDAGFDPKEEKPETQQESQKEKPKEKKLSVSLRHKTEYPRYRCAGLALTQNPETYEVTEEQLEKLKKDPWVEAGEGKEAKA